jgi:hypothetical protein
MSIVVDTDHQVLEHCPAERAAEVWTRTLEGTAVTPGGTVRHQHTAVPTLIAHDILDAIRAALAAGAPRVVRLCPGPGGNAHPLADWVLAPLPAWCEREDVALAVDYGAGRAAPLSEVAHFARSAPEVPLLLHGDRLGADPADWRLLDRCPNVLLQVTADVDATLLVAAVDEFGAHRFVFGSRDRTSPLAESTFGALSDSAREAVLGGNASLLDERGWRDRYL